MFVLCQFTELWCIEQYCTNYTCAEYTMRSNTAVPRHDDSYCRLGRARRRNGYSMPRRGHDLVGATLSVGRQQRGRRTTTPHPPHRVITWAPQGFREYGVPH